VVAQDQLVAPVTPALGRRPVGAVAVELNDQRVCAEVGVDPHTRDHDMALGKRHATLRALLAEHVEAEFESAVGVRQPGVVRVKGLGERSVAPASPNKT
jgi:hypothetical protein